jgi:succinoglycan biosynthesis transport protein ExoP
VERSGSRYGLRDVVSVLRRRKWIFVLCVLAVPAAAAVFSLRQSHVYQAAARVVLTNPNPNAENIIGGQPASGPQPQQSAAAQPEVARVPVVLENVLKALKLTTWTPERLLSHSSVTLEHGAALEFKVRDRSRTLALQLANMWAQQYGYYRRSLDAQPVSVALETIDARLAELRKSGDQLTPAYESALERQQQLQTLVTLLRQNPLPVRPATGTTQIQPRTVRNTLIGVGLGAALGLLLVFLLDALDTRVRSVQNIASRLGIPLIGFLPAPPKRLRKSGGLVMLADPNSFHAEPFRTLRTNLEFVNLDRGARKIMVTSAVQGEGKSTTLANLGVALARSGKRVILVDADLRRPYLDQLFDLGGRPGLTDVTLGRAELADALVPVVLTDSTKNGAGPKIAKSNGSGSTKGAGVLSVVGSGTLPPDPGEFVGSEALDRVLDELEDAADLVLIDSPPLLSLSDGLTLSEKVDAMVVVCRLNTIRRPMLTELRRLLDASPAEKLGFVAAEAEAEDEYGYGHGYGFGYGYRYGYGYGYHRRETTPQQEVA